MATRELIVCVGDAMLELITDAAAGATYRQTVVLKPEDFSVGGPVCNLYWYFLQLGYETSIATHYGAPERDNVTDVLEHADRRFLAEKKSSTDILIVLHNLSTPAIYIAGELSDCDVQLMMAGLKNTGTIIFAGSRHESLRAAYLERIASLQNATVIFSPSYTVYNFKADELHRLLVLSHMTFVNEIEAEYLRQVLGLGNIDDLMRIPRQCGVVTLGPRGAQLYPLGLDCIHVPSVSGSDEDVIGAGEAFVCGFLASRLANGSWQLAGELGCAVAAQVVRHKRVRVPIDRLLFAI